MNDNLVGALKDWPTLNTQLSQLSEADLHSLINYECSTNHRKVYIERLHQRYSILRTKREREELITGGLL